MKTFTVETSKGPRHVRIEWSGDNLMVIQCPADIKNPKGLDRWDIRKFPSGNGTGSWVLYSLDDALALAKAWDKTGIADDKSKEWLAQKSTASYNGVAQAGPLGPLADKQ
ncbi:MAG: hypothetical protein GY914_12680 [Prochlorococcus sp.]|jgi:hypothetical protein|nr:hypothetical protein [Prochlorococcus sp.]CAI8160541.1 MAG: Uncharacterised protein [Prochlorococcus marinus str. MIT 9215]